MKSRKGEEKKLAREVVVTFVTHTSCGLGASDGDYHSQNGSTQGRVYHDFQRSTTTPEILSENKLLCLFFPFLSLPVNAFASLSQMVLGNCIYFRPLVRCKQSKHCGVLKGESASPD